ncbi:hypothetical protein [Anaeromassilibacillus sp. SJQ-1]|uniref:hypothetical protein n=1 Tax=Anaeromassilibacillus sp. SJQ-1 TaxID=3375419 RepID=UPI0006C7ACFC
MHKVLPFLQPKGRVIDRQKAGGIIAQMYEQKVKRMAVLWIAFMHRRPVPTIRYFSKARSI